MKIDMFIPNDNCYEELAILKTRCSQFITESHGLPLLKNLSQSYGDFYRIKVRLKKTHNENTDIFNQAFEHETPKLHQRAIFANGLTSFEPEDDELEPFYIFPIDGYNFMYCFEIENSSSNHKQTFDVLLENFGPTKGEEIIRDVLRFSYASNDLHEGIKSGAEIIIYNIPFYYAIRESTVENYSGLLENIKSQ